MFLVRSVERKDLEGLYAVAKYLDSYNLPADRPTLKKLIAVSIASFNDRIEKDDQKFIFVLEDAKTGKVIGSSLILARHGTKKLPHLAFKTGRGTLTLIADSHGFTEIGGLVLLPQYRGTPEELGRFLSWVRFLYMARHSERFCRRVLVEYLPALDPQTGNLFWKCLGRRFTGLSYHQADRLSATNKKFILSSFPKGKIRLSALPAAARKLIGGAGPGARASLRILRHLGFRYYGQVDPFDGGPHYVAERRKIPVIKRCRTYRFDNSLEKKDTLSQKTGLILCEKGGAARAAASPFAVHAGKIRLPEEAAKVLKLKGGEKLSVVSAT